MWPNLVHRSPSPATETSDTERAKAGPPDRGKSDVRFSENGNFHLRISGIVRQHAWPAAVGLGLGLLALGPALDRGFVLSYDMVFVPDPPIGAADIGLAGVAARAVPSDLTVALAAKIIPAEFVQKIILLAIFVLACAGAAALLASGWPRREDGDALPALPRLAAGVCYAWNPFVAERLILGQWALLLGYAGLPWVLRELGRRTGAVRPGRLALAVVPALIGGFAAMSITILAAVPVAVCAGPGGLRADRLRRVAVVLGVLAVACLPWLIPSLIVAVHTDPAGAAVFAARADTPFGAAGSLLMLGGIWNEQVVPAGYGGLASTSWLLIVLAAIAGYVAAGRPRRLCPGLGVAAVIGFCLAALGSWAPTLSALQSAISFWPGFGVLRDGQVFVAPLALAESVGLGAGVAALIAAAAGTRSGQPALAADRAGGGPGHPGKATGRAAGGRAIRDKPATGPAAVIGVIALIASVALLPGLAWGAVGRLRTAEYPADWITARHLIDTSPPDGSALLLPWEEYRRYRWNHGQPVFDPWPKLLARSMIWNDALQVGSTTIATENRSARRLTPVINSVQPLTSVLRAAGVRYVIVDAGPMLGRPRSQLAELARLPGAQVVIASRDLIVFRLPG
ncbi:MAG TPA: hypothetical protein VN695_09435 [Streptosporangiaceae bacterium]|nr:hypothetical protein [Streptosporangiaceae bacterium]